MNDNQKTALLNAIKTIKTSSQQITALADQVSTEYEQRKIGLKSLFDAMDPEKALTDGKGIDGIIQATSLYKDEAERLKDLTNRIPEIKNFAEQEKNRAGLYAKMESIVNG